MEAKRYLFTGGGTGGHVTPNLAIIGALKARNPAATFLYLGKKGGYESTHLGESIAFVPILCAPMVSPRAGLRFVRMSLLILLGTCEAAFQILKFRPHVVVASGGYVSVPTVLAAWILRRPVYVHEQNVHPGRANRLLARFARRIGVAFEETLGQFPKHKTTLAGYPIRQQITSGSAEAAEKRLGISESARVLLVVGGSMGPRSINRAIVEALPLLLRIDNLVILHATGLADTPAYRALADTEERLRSKSTPEELLAGRYHYQAFFRRIEDIYARADLVVGRSGAGTIMELAALGKPSILIPKSDVQGEHQLQNALALQRLRAAEVLYEERCEEDGKALTRVRGDALARKIRELIENPQELEEMGLRARALGVPDSLERHLKSLDEAMVPLEQVRTAKSAEEVGFLIGADGKRTELCFPRNTIGSGRMCDVRLSPNNSGHRALLLRQKTEQGVSFELVPERGNVRVDGVPIINATAVPPGSRISLGEETLSLTVEAEERTLVSSGGGFGGRVMITGLGTLVSRLSGFVRSAIMAALFGLGPITDLFVLGLTIANFLRGVFAEVAVDSAFLPTFIHLQRTGQHSRARRLYSAVLSLILILSGAATLALIVSLPLWLPWLPGLAARGLMKDAITVTGVMLPYLVLISVAALFSAVLRSANRFGIPAFSSVMFNVGIVVGCLLYPILGVASLGVGVLLGGIGQILVQLPALLSKEVREGYGIRYEPTLGLKEPAVRKVGRVAPNILADVGITKLGSVVDIVLAMPMAAGMVSALNWALVVFHLPFGLLSQSINTVILKELSDRQALQKKESVGRLLVSGVGWNVFLLLPISAVLIILARPLVDVLFGFGQFSATDGSNVALALRCYAIGLVGWGLTSLLGRFFAARMEQNRNTITSALALVANIGLSIALVRMGLGIAGLALGTSASFLLCAIMRMRLLLTSLQREGVAVNTHELRRGLFKSAVATACAAFSMLVAYQAVSGFHGFPPFFSRVFVLGVPSLFGISAFLAASRLMNSAEMEDIVLRLNRGASSGIPREAPPENPYCIDSAQRLAAYVKRTPASRYDGQRLALRLRTFMTDPKWDVRNIGVKLAGELKLKSLRDILIVKATDRRPAKWSHRILGGDFVDPGFVRRNAVLALKQLGEPDGETLDAWQEALRDPYYEVRTTAANVFAALGDDLPPDRHDTVVSILSEEARSKRNFEVSRAAVLALGSVARNERIVELFRKLHYHHNWRVRDAVVTGYAKLFERGVLLDAGRLLALLDDVLTTSEGFTPRFTLKENMVDLQRRLLQARKEITTRPDAAPEDEAPLPKRTPAKRTGQELPPFEAEAHA